MTTDAACKALLLPLRAMPYQVPIFTAEDREQWDNICTAMAWVAEELDVEQEDL